MDNQENYNFLNLKGCLKLKIINQKNHFIMQIIEFNLKKEILY